MIIDDDSQLLAFSEPSTDETTELSEATTLLNTFGLHDIPKDRQEFVEQFKKQSNLEAVGEFIYDFLLGGTMDSGPIKVSKDQDPNDMSFRQFNNGLLHDQQQQFIPMDPILIPPPITGTFEQSLEAMMINLGYLDYTLLEQLKLNNLDTVALVPFLRKITVEDIETKLSFRKLSFNVLSNYQSHEEFFQNLELFGNACT